MSQRDVKRQTLRPITSQSNDNAVNSRQSLGPQRINKGGAGGVTAVKGSSVKDSRKSMVPTTSGRRKSMANDNTRQSIGNFKLCIL